jgi:hypothetical protein
MEISQTTKVFIVAWMETNILHFPSHCRHLTLNDAINGATKLSKQDHKEYIIISNVAVITPEPIQVKVNAI